MRRTKKPQARPRASSTARAEEGASDDVELSEVTTPSSEFPPTLLDKPIEGPRKGALGKLFGGAAPAVGAPEGSSAPGEESRKERRKGAQRLEDDDSVLESERGTARRGPTELDEVDGLDFEEELGKKEGEIFSDNRAVDDDDGFGDFKEGQGRPR